MDVSASYQSNPKFGQIKLFFALLGGTRCSLTESITALRNSDHMLLTVSPDLCKNLAIILALYAHLSLHYLLFLSPLTFSVSIPAW